MGEVTPFRRRPRPQRKGRECVCGSFWRPGPTSDPAWIFTADRRFSMLPGMLDCPNCGRWKTDVLREQAEARKAAESPAIPSRERPPAPVVSFRQRDT